MKVDGYEYDGMGNMNKAMNRRELRCGRHILLDYHCWIRWNDKQRNTNTFNTTPMLSSRSPSRARWPGFCVASGPFLPPNSSPLSTLTLSLGLAIRKSIGGAISSGLGGSCESVLTHVADGSCLLSVS